MKCNCCGAYWNLISDGFGTEKCPICGIDFNENTEKQYISNYAELMVLLVKRYGSRIILDEKRVWAYFNDYFPYERDKWELLIGYIVDNDKLIYEDITNNLCEDTVHKYNNIEETEDIKRWVVDFLLALIAKDNVNVDFYINQNELLNEYVEQNLLRAEQQCEKSDSNMLLLSKYAISKEAYEKAFFLLNGLVEKENTEAKLMISELYYKGFGIKQDVTKAMNILMSVTQKDNHILNFRLGYAFDKGKGVKKDKQLAEKYYRVAVEQGNVNAAYCLYELLLNTKPKEAMSFLEMAVNNEMEFAEYEYAIHYLYGDVVEENLNNAIYYLERAFEHGSEDARIKLYSIYKSGFKVNKDLERTKIYEGGK